MLPADIYHRYLDLKGTENIFVCGSDVHGTPLELEALEKDMSVEKLAEQQNKKVKQILDDFQLDFSVWGMTDNKYNKQQTHEMFIQLYKNGFIKEETQELPYSKEDGRFLPDRYIEGECPHCGGLARGDQCDDCGKLLDPEEIIEPHSTISGSEDIDFRETKHLFIDLPAFKEELNEWLESADPKPVPDSSIKEVENAVENAEERAITRDIDWGFDIPVRELNEDIEDENLDVAKLDPEEYDEKVFYVWFDAPIGYIGFTRQLFDNNDKWKDYWINERSETIYSIGKDNTIFHTVIWPSMLIGASGEDFEYTLPDYEFIQQFLMAEDTQFSKSRGKGLSTEDALEMYPADYWRFYLAANLPQDHDTKFSWNDFESRINNVLNDTVGNFVNRTLALIEKWFDNEVPVGDLETEDEKVIEEAEDIVDEYQQLLEDKKLKNGVEKALELARLGDQYLSEEEPWNNEDRRAEVLHTAVQIVRGVGVLMYPYTPEASQKIADMLNTEFHSEEGYDEFVDPLLGGISAGHELGEREILFEKVDVEDKKNEVEKQESEEKAEDHVLNIETVSFDDFIDMDIRVAEVLSVEEHPNADRLYKVRVDVGDTELQTCAGLKNHYSKKELEGRKVIVLANLEPTELRGEKSECMMLAAEDEEEKVSLLGTDKDLPLGSGVK